MTDNEYRDDEEDWIQRNGYERVTLNDLRLDDTVYALDSPGTFGIVVDLPYLREWVDIEWHSDYNSPDPFPTHIMRCRDTDMIVRKADE